MRVLAYVRQSSQREDETEDTSLSLNTQIAAIEQHASQRGYGPIAKVYADHDLKGYDADRPALNELLDDVRRGDLVIVYKFSRFARDLVLQEISAQKIEKRGATVESVYEGRDRLIRQIHGAFAEHYSREQSDQLKRAFRERKSRGLYHGATPFGYQRAYVEANGRTIGVLEPLEPEADLVRRMFADFTAGKTMLRIANEATAAGAVSKRGNALRMKAVRDILLNPVYAGGIPFDDEIRWDCHPAIVTRQQWLDVQPRLGENTVRTKRSGLAAQQPLHQLVRHECGRISSNVGYRPTRRHVSEFVTFRCTHCTQYPNGQRAIPDRRSISANAATALVRELLTADLAPLIDPEAMTSAAMAALTDPAREFERKRLASAISKIDTRFDRLREWYLSGNESVEWLTAQKDALDAERSDLAAQLAAIPSEVDTGTLRAAAASLASIRAVMTAASPEAVADALRSIGHFQFGPSGARIVYRPPFAMLVPNPSVVMWWDRRYRWWATV